MLRAVLMALDMRQVTTRQDLKEIEQRVADYEGKVDGALQEMREDMSRLRVDMDGIDARIADKVQQEVDRAMAGAGSASTASSTRPPARRAADGAFVPRLFRVRGWAPPGAPPDAKITKAEAVKLDEDIRRLLPAMATTELELGRLGVANYELRYYVADSAQSTLRRWKHKVQDVLAQVRMRGLALQCGFQVNPERARRYREYKEAVTALEGHLGGEMSSKWEACDATMQIYSSRLTVLGSFQGDVWQWHDGVFKAEGLRPWDDPAEAAGGAAPPSDDPAATPGGDTQVDVADAGTPASAL